MTLNEKLLKELEGTETLDAFKRGGAERFSEYQELSKDDFEGKKRDAFFRSLLGDEIAEKIIADNQRVHGAKIPLHNHYIAWGNSCAS